MAFENVTQSMAQIPALMLQARVAAMREGAMRRQQALQGTDMFTQSMLQGLGLFGQMEQQGKERAFRTEQAGLDRGLEREKLAQQQEQFLSSLDLDNEKMAEGMRQFDIQIGFDEQEADRRHVDRLARFGLDVAKFSEDKKTGAAQRQSLAATTDKTEAETDFMNKALADRLRTLGAEADSAVVTAKLQEEMTRAQVDTLAAKGGMDRSEALKWAQGRIEWAKGIEARGYAALLDADQLIAFSKKTPEERAALEAGVKEMGRNARAQWEQVLQETINSTLPAGSDYSQLLKGEQLAPGFEPGAQSGTGDIWAMLGEAAKSVVGGG